jgi:hypothetical protein
VQPDHEADRQPGPADALAIERAEGGGEAIPVDQAGQAHQGMAAIDEVHQGGAEELGLFLRRQYGRHRRAPARRCADRITLPRQLQQGSGFARFRPALRRRLAIADTFGGQKAEEFRGLRRSSRLTIDPLGSALKATTKLPRAAYLYDWRHGPAGARRPLSRPP